MRKIKEVLRLKFANGRSIRQISKSCDIGRSTAADYIGRAERAGLTWPLPADLDDKAIETLLYPTVKNGGPEKRSMPSMEQLYRELKRKSVTLQLLWYEYKQKNSDGYGNPCWDSERRLKPPGGLNRRKKESLIVHISPTCSVHPLLHKIMGKALSYRQCGR